MTNRFTLIFLAVFAMSLPASALLTIQPKPNDGIKFSTSQVWEMTVVSTVDQAINVIITAEVSDDKGRALARLQSAPVSLKPGANTLGEYNVSVHDINYINRDFGNYELRNGFLPAGDYTYCISIQCADQHCYDLYKSETNDRICVDVTGIVPSPLLLSSPDDDQILEITRPDFSWIPPMPLGSDPDISYEFTLVHLQANQSGENAIRRNRPLYRMGGIQQLTMAFPAELEDLVVGERYGWQVTANLGQTPVQTSEVWEFEIKKEEQRLVAMPYIRLKPDLTDRYNAVNTANFVYYKKSTTSVLKYEIFDHQDKKITRSPVLVQTKYGENQLQIDLRALDLEVGQDYTIRLYDSDGNSYDLKIKYFFKP